MAACLPPAGSGSGTTRRRERSGWIGVTPGAGATRGHRVSRCRLRSRSGGRSPVGGGRGAHRHGDRYGAELLAAAQGCDFHQPLRSSQALERARALLRARVPMLGEDRHMHPDMAIAIELVRDGHLVEAVEAALPGVCGP